MKTATVIKEKLLSNLFLGTGGAKPGVSILANDCGYEKGLPHHLLDSSVYAGDIDIERCRIAAGTKNGRIYIITPNYDSNDLTLNINRNLYQSTPVISVCFAGGNNLVSTDTAGRCLLWKLDISSGAADILPATKGVICSLCRIDKNIIVGLSLSGQLLFWDISKKEIANIIDCHKPVGHLVLPKLKYWKAKNALIWPACEGLLSICYLDSFKINTYQAHNKLFSAIIVDGDELITIGAYDRTVKKWFDIEGNCETCCYCPEGIISASVYLNTSAEKQFLLLDGSGKTAIYIFETDAVKQISLLAGSHYRCIISISEYAHDMFLEARRIETAKSIQKDAESVIGYSPSEPVDSHCRKLENLGFEALSLGLKAKSANIRQDTAGELKAYSRLLELLPYNDQRCFSHIRNYIDVLVRTWQIAVAEKIIGSLPEGTISEHISNWVKGTHKVQVDGNWLAESEIGLPALMEAACITGSKFTGRWLTDTQEPLILPEKGITSQMFADKYQTLRQDSNLLSIYSAKTLTLWKLVTGKPAEEIEVVIFGSTETKIPAIYPAVQIIRAGSSDMLVLSTIFDTNNADCDIDVARYNRCLLDIYNTAVANKNSTAWPDNFHQLIIMTVGLLTNQLCWNRKNSGAVNND